MKQAIYFSMLSLLLCTQACSYLPCKAADQQVSTGADTPVNKASYQQFVEQGSAAIKAGDYDTAYNLALPYGQVGNADAQFTLGLIVSGGHGPAATLTKEKKDALAFSWFKQAAKNGNKEAAQMLADTYAKAWYGQPKSPAQAQCWQAVVDEQKPPSDC